MMSFTERIKQMTVERATAVEIKQEALRQGMKTLRQSGWQRVAMGETTPEEVLRLTADADTLALENEDTHAPV